MRAALERFDLPFRVPDGLAADDLLEAMWGDKKVRERAVRFALPARLGEMLQRADGAWTVEVEQQEILQTINANR